jgi:hypothetical protein
VCGIFGWQMDRPVEQGQMIALATTLGLLNETRGKESWGIFAPASREQAGMMEKGTGALTMGPALYELARFPALVGHTRYATKGLVSKENAHPFTFGPVTGCHNGAIYNDQDMNKEHHREFAVDSMHIFAHLAEGKPLGELEGYGAIAYTHAERRTLIYLGRFMSGEMAVARVKDIGVVFSSNEDHLKLALRVANLPLEHCYLVEQQKLYLLARGVLTETGLTLPITGIKKSRVYGRGAEDDGYSDGYGSHWGAGFYDSTTRTWRSRDRGRHGGRRNGKGSTVVVLHERDKDGERSEKGTEEVNGVVTGNERTPRTLADGLKLLGP